MIAGQTCFFLPIGDSLTKGVDYGSHVILPTTDTGYPANFYPNRWLARIIASGNYPTVSGLMLSNIYPEASFTAVAPNAAASGLTSTQVLVDNASYWNTTYADICTIELGVNNTLANGYATQTIARAAWVSDVSQAVLIIHSNGCPLANILIFGMPPHGTFRISGANEEDLISWNQVMYDTTAGLGCTFVPIMDVYDAAATGTLDARGFYHGSYDPNADISNYIENDPVEGDSQAVIDAKTANSTHPNAAGYIKWYEKVLAALPDNLLAHRHIRTSSNHSLDK